MPSDQNFPINNQEDIQKMNNFASRQELYKIWQQQKKDIKSVVLITKRLGAVKVTMCAIISCVLITMGSIPTEKFTINDTPELITISFIVLPIAWIVLIIFVFCISICSWPRLMILHKINTRNLSHFVGNLYFKKLYEKDNYIGIETLMTLLLFILLLNVTRYFVLSSPILGNLLKWAFH